jgi:DNA-binding NtrC family response regulator
MASARDTFTLLYVDDDLASRQTLGLMLMRNYPQLKVVSADNGFDALVKMQAHKPEIFIVDLQMPFLDGRGFIEEIKQAEWRHEIIVVSACSDSETIGNFMKSGVSCYVTKPVNFKFLCRNINSAIENLLSERNPSISPETSTVA